MNSFCIKQEPNCEISETENEIFINKDIRIKVESDVIRHNHIISSCETCETPIEPRLEKVKLEPNIKQEIKHEYCIADSTCLSQCNNEPSAVLTQNDKPSTGLTQNNNGSCNGLSENKSCTGLTQNSNDSCAELSENKSSTGLTQNSNDSCAELSDNKSSTDLIQNNSNTHSCTGLTKNINSFNVISLKCNSRSSSVHSHTWKRKNVWKFKRNINRNNSPYLRHKSTSSLFPKRMNAHYSSCESVFFNKNQECFSYKKMKFYSDELPFYPHYNRHFKKYPYKNSPYYTGSTRDSDYFNSHARNKENDNLFSETKPENELRVLKMTSTNNQYQNAHSNLLQPHNNSKDSVPSTSNQSNSHLETSNSGESKILCDSLDDCMKLITNSEIEIDDKITSDYNKTSEMEQEQSLFDLEDAHIEEEREAIIIEKEINNNTEIINKENLKDDRELAAVLTSDVNNDHVADSSKEQMEKLLDQRTITLKDETFIIIDEINEGESPNAEDILILKEVANDEEIACVFNKRKENHLCTKCFVEKRRIKKNINTDVVFLKKKECNVCNTNIPIINIEES